MKKRFTEEQIIKALQRNEAGEKTSDLCRELGIVAGTFYKWKGKYGGLEISEARRLKAVDAENSKLKRMLADKMIEVEALQDVLGKKW